MTESFETILVETKGRVGVITLNRPQALNALNGQLLNEVLAAGQAFDADEGIGAIVITGSEKAFAAGADIKEMKDKSFRDVSVGELFGGWDDFAAIRTPIIAAVSGYALGGGAEVAMMCDIIIASETAKFGQPEINIGVIPGMGGSQRLTRAIGKAKAMDMILTGRMMGAEEALASGLVSRVVPVAELMDVAMEVATTIASKSLPVAYAAKEAVSLAFETTLAEGVRAERRGIYSLFALDDQKEGMAAFAEKRDPNFTHR